MFVSVFILSKFFIFFLILPFICILFRQILINPLHIVLHLIDIIMNQYQTNICALKDCVMGDEQHEFSKECGESNDFIGDEHKELYDKRINRSVSFDSSTENIIRAINNMFRYWLQPDNQETVFENPGLIIEYILSQPLLARYAAMYSKARLGFQVLDIATKRELMINFIHGQSVREFQCFDMILHGIEIAQKVRNEKDLETLKMEFESKVTYLEDAARTVSDCKETFSGAQEILQASINQISEVSHKLVTEKRMLELIIEKDPKEKLIQSVSPIEDKKCINVVKNQGVILPLKSDGTLDTSLGSNLNPSFGPDEILLMTSLASITSEAILKVLSVPWNILIKWMKTANIQDTKKIATVIAKAIMDPSFNAQPAPTSIMTI